MQVVCHNAALTNLFGITVTAFIDLQPEQRDRVLLDKLIDALVIVNISVPNKKSNYPKFTIKQFTRLPAPAFSATNRSLNFNTAVEATTTEDTGANANHAKRPTRANSANVADTDTNADADAGPTKR